MEDKVSIVIPTYNRKKCIDRALESCLDQTYENIEVVICDDQSTDGTYEYLCEKYSEEKRVVICTSKGIGKGAQVARKVAIDNATGDYIAFLDSDDYLLPDSISNRKAYFSNGVGLVYGDVYIEKHGHRRLCQYEDIESYCKEEFIFSELALCIYSSIMVKSSYLKQYVDLDEKLPAWQDDDLMIQMSKCSQLRYAHCIVATICETKHSISREGSNNYLGLKHLVKRERRNIVRYTSIWRLMIWYIRIFDLHLFYLASNAEDEFSGILLNIVAVRIKRFLSKYFIKLFV